MANYTITFTLQGQEHTVTFSDPDLTNLDEEFALQAGQFYFLAMAHAMAEKEEKAAKFDLECAYAQLDKEYRSTLSGTKVTEKVIESNILTDARYVDIQNKYLAAMQNTGVLRAACEAMRQRKDMLVQLGAQRRAEVAAGIGTL